jgi:hypothetical protein
MQKIIRNAKKLHEKSAIFFKVGLFVAFESKTKTQIDVKFGRK